MQPKTALSLALVSAALAVGAIVADLNFTLTASLESRGADGEWRLAAQAPQPEDFYRSPHALNGCAGRELRLNVDNDRPVPADVPIVVRATNRSSNPQTLVETRWHLDAFEERRHEFIVPQEFLDETTAESGTEGKPTPEYAAQVTVTVGRLEFWVCVRGER